MTRNLSLSRAYRHHCVCNMDKRRGMASSRYSAVSTRPAYYQPPADRYLLRWLSPSCVGATCNIMCNAHRCRQRLVWCVTCNTDIAPCVLINIRNARHRGVAAAASNGRAATWAVSGVSWRVLCGDALNVAHATTTYWHICTNARRAPLTSYYRVTTNSSYR